MRIIQVAILCVLGLFAAPVFGQEQASNTNMQILLDKVKADKKLVVAANMELTEVEGKAFWPIFEAYQKDLQTLNERLAKTILAYADAYNKKTLTDAQAMQFTNQALEIDQEEINLRRTHGARLARAIPGIKAARYLQIENKIRAAIRFELAAGIPLVP